MEVGTLYPALKQSHVALVIASVALYVARGVGVLAGATWPMKRGVRFASVGIDTLLLAAGLALWALLAQLGAATSWVAVKVGLVVIYIGLGSLALKRAPSRGLKALAFAASLVVIVLVASIALAHDAHSPWRWLGSLR